MIAIKKVKTCSNAKIAPRVEIIAEDKENKNIKLRDLYYTEIEKKKYYFRVFATETFWKCGDIIQEIRLQEYGYHSKISDYPEFTPSMLLKRGVIFKEDNPETIAQVEETAGYL